MVHRRARARTEATVVDLCTVVLTRGNVRAIVRVRAMQCLSRCLELLWIAREGTCIGLYSDSDTDEGVDVWEYRPRWPTPPGPPRPPVPSQDQGVAQDTRTPSDD